MTLNFALEHEAFRQEVRAFIAENLDEHMRAMMAQSKNHYLDKAEQVRWFKRLGRKGWIAPGWPVEYGGPGWDLTQRYIFDMEMAIADAPDANNMGVKMCGPVLMAFGTPEQKAQHLPKILNSDVWWCQGYSEPNAGSDLASLSLKAERDGDDYVLNGSKMWTTHAQWADWMFCLARTSNEGRRQNGISFLLIDMKTPGITVAPIATLDGPAEGQQEVNQTFFDNVRVPVSNRVGAEGDGWTCAKHLLQFERGGALAPLVKARLSKLRRIASVERADDGQALIEDPDFWRKFCDLEIRMEALSAFELRTFAVGAKGQPLGAVSSALKVIGSELVQAVTELAVEAVGVYAQPFVRDTWEMLRPGTRAFRAGPNYAAAISPTYFNHRKYSIYAGSNEIQRNIIAKMILGL
ncbi:pimeloyl-CoA dehydrogenase large subunit [Sphingomonas sp. Root710]|uniref:acyl-CoA dehydrogenase family protein n=1 Tax=Sphingomonas sp. Root710 TaxID=1736594 RepID=UPI0006F4DAFF|nr:acyl-CoA dehydrogenase family protein [Sphingomonas sp. Root710]KRB86737.1 pimeloyl-CoA dehydrogenase large subunit [Sphingomonas sp. Root710]